MALKDFFQQQQFQFTGNHFHLHNEATLEVSVDGELQIKHGVMIASNGGIKFKRKSSLAGGIGQFIKSKASGEGVTISRAIGKGSMLLADRGKTILVMELENEAISVNGNDILAFDSNLKHSLKRNKGAGLAVGLFNVVIEGTGKVSITCHKKAMVIPVTSGLITDPNATVCWSANLKPKLKADFGLKNLIGRGGGETVQYEWSGEGFVVIQPYEEVLGFED